MSDSLTNESLRGPSGAGRKMGFLVFFVGFFVGFVVALALNGKVLRKDSGEATVTSKPEAKESVAEHDESVPSSERSSERPSGPSSELSSAESSSSGEHADTETMDAPAQEMVISRQTRDRLLTVDFLNLLQDAELHRFRYEGETKGLRLTKIRTGSVYEKAGFKDGDIIEQINGLAVADIEKKPKKAREQLPVADRVSFKVRRDDKVITIKIKVAGDATP